MAEDANNIKFIHPATIIDEIDQDLNGIQGYYVDKAKQIGYARDAFRTIRPAWEDLGNQRYYDPPGTTPLIISGEQALIATRNEIRSIRNQIGSTPSPVDKINKLGASMLAITGSTASMEMKKSGLQSSDLSILNPSPNRHEEYAERFTNWDPVLGNTYRQVWEVLYGTKSDPERAALFLIRQAFDTLFERLAPNDEVRASAFWKPKKGENTNLVERSERIQYAVAHHIKEKDRSKTLAESSKHMLEVYQALNYAHNRRELDRDKARKALIEMQRILEDWADALEI